MTLLCWWQGSVVETCSIMYISLTISYCTAIAESALDWWHFLVDVVRYYSRCTQNEYLLQNVPTQIQMNWNAWGAELDQLQ